MKAYRLKNLPKEHKINLQKQLKEYFSDGYEGDIFLVEYITESLTDLAGCIFEKIGIFEKHDVEFLNCYWDASYCQGSGAGIEYKITSKAGIKKYLKAAGLTKKQRKQIAYDYHGGNLDALWSESYINASHSSSNYYHWRTYELDSNLHEHIIDLHENIEKQIHENLYTIYEAEKENMIESDVDNYFNGVDRDSWIFINNQSKYIIDLHNQHSYLSENIELKLENLKTKRAYNVLKNKLTKKENTKEKARGKI